jgi:hypothetical protein
VHGPQHINRHKTPRRDSTNASTAYNSQNSAIAQKKALHKHQLIPVSLILEY